jgi:hypothetical protein
MKKMFPGDYCEVDVYSIEDVKALPSARLLQKFKQTARVLFFDEGGRARPSPGQYDSRGDRALPFHRQNLVLLEAEILNRLNMKQDATHK